MIRGLFLSATLFVSSLYGESACPTLFNNEQAAQVAEQVMNTWFSSVKNKDTQAVSHLFAPRALILHSVGAPLSRDQEINLLKGFHLGGYQFTDFCAVQNEDVIVATFASKTFKQDVSQTGLNFLSDSKAYRMVVLQKIKGQWLIIGYANMNPLKESTSSTSKSSRDSK